MNRYSLKITAYRFLLVNLIMVFSYANANNIEPSKNWNFKVYLDGDEIGTHSFSVINNDDYQEIHTKASFDVKFLFFTAYSYRHENVEQWRGSCLQNINAITDDNGDDYKVLGELNSNAFVVNTNVNENNTQTSHQSCLKTFSYWDSSFLKEKTLLNSQTGELVDIESEYIETETVKYKGKEVILTPMKNGAAGCTSGWSATVCPGGWWGRQAAMARWCGGCFPSFAIGRNCRILRILGQQSRTHSKHQII